MEETPPPSPPPSPKRIIIIDSGVYPKPVPAAPYFAFRPPPPPIAAHGQRLYAMALEAERGRDRQPMLGYRLYWFGSVLLGTMDVVADPAGYIVLGSHASCEVHLHDSSRVALRHLLLRVTALDDGFPVLHLMDLRTGMGFEVEDAGRHRSLTTTGAVTFRLGTHTVIALPSVGRYPAKLPTPNVVMRPEPLDFSRFALTMVAEGAEPVAAKAGEDFEFVIEGRGKRGVVRVSAADLDRGLLVGRAHATATGVLALFHEAISRVHLFVIREKGVVHLHDVASLVGTYQDGVRVRWVELRESGSTVELARAGAVKLTFRGL